MLYALLSSMDITTLINVSNVRLNKRQLISFNRFEKKDQLRYIMSFLGVKDCLNPNRSVIESDKTFPKVYTKDHGALRNWLSINRKLYDTSYDKKPTTNNNDWIGVEVECFLPKDQFDIGSSDDYECNCECNCTCSGCPIGNCGCECDGSCRDNCECGIDQGTYTSSVGESIKKALIKNIQVVEDGSLNPNDRDLFGIEIKCLFRMSDYSNLEKLCKWLKTNNATVNETCGLHVHLDARDVKDMIINEHRNKLAFSDGNFVYNLDKSLKYLSAMLPESRQNNTYCKKGYSFTERYSMINCTALSKHGTIEVRAHSGTVNFTKIINWVKILQAIKTAKSVKVNSFDKWVGSIELSEELTNYAKERISKFSPEVLYNNNLLTLETVENEESEAA